MSIYHFIKLLFAGVFCLYQILNLYLSMKSLTRFIAFVGLFFAFALSCPANATNNEKSKTFVDVSFDGISLEVADFSISLDSETSSDYLKQNNNKEGVFKGRLSIDVFIYYSDNVKDLKSQEFTRIKRFPNARDSLVG